MPTLLFSEIQELTRQQTSLRSKYYQLNELLQRVCNSFSEDYNTSFTGLFSQLNAVCQANKIDKRDIDFSRRRIRLVLRGEMLPDEQTFARDCGHLSHFIAQLYHTKVPSNLAHLYVPEKREPQKIEAIYLKKRAIVEQINKDNFVCSTVDGDEWTVVPNERTSKTFKILETGMTVNLIDTKVSDGKYEPRLIIFEPDFLIDVSQLAGCMMHYGNHPFNYLLKMFEPVSTKIFFLLGNLANQFVDDIVNSKKSEQKQIYLDACKKNFRDFALQYLVLSSETNTEFFEDTKRHFANIYKIVHQNFGSRHVNIKLDEIILEPSFICEALGLRGRYDIMSSDRLSLIELKSGKAEEFYSKPVKPKKDNLMQMTLYAEMLHYNFLIPRDKIKSYLLYSKYPVIYEERNSAEAVAEIMFLRNRIVKMLQAIRKGNFSKYLPYIREDVINENKINDKLYNNFLKPRLSEITTPLKEMKGVLKDYFCEYLTFLVREQFMSKTSDMREGGSRGFARVWNADFTTKILTGDILYDLKIKETKGNDSVENIVFQIPAYDDDFIPNFRSGEIVQVYQRNKNEDNVLNKQLIRAHIVNLRTDEIELALTFPQRNSEVFPADALYAIEHDYTDSSFNTAFRGLFQLLKTEKSRQELLLGLRKPETNPNIRLKGEYGEQMNSIVLQVMQAKDYFLLVGPPGTGKTSVALKNITEEFVATSPDGQALLLMAYTNRAVDEICGMLDGINANYIRIGNEHACAPEFRKRLLSKRVEKCDRRQDAARIIQTTDIYVGTVLSISGKPELFELKSIGCAVIDEASQILEPFIVGLLSVQNSRGKVCIPKFILIGDHKQLPAVVVQSEKNTKVEMDSLQQIGLDNLRNSFFQRLSILQQKYDWRGVTALLNKQGRMHPEISKFVSNVFYEGRLEEVPCPHQKENLNLNKTQSQTERFIAETRMGFVNVSPPEIVENVKVNTNEAKVVAKLLKSLINLYERNGEEIYTPKQVGIIVPFRNQIRAVRNELRKEEVPDYEDITIDTVECFQGSQRDFIFFSTTISRRYQLDTLSNVQTSGDVIIDRKLNVAITRARKQMFIVGNEQLLSDNQIYRNLIGNCRKIKMEVDEIAIN